MIHIEFNPVNLLVVLVAGHLLSAFLEWFVHYLQHQRPATSIGSTTIPGHGSTDSSGSEEHGCFTSFTMAASRASEEAGTTLSAGR